MNEARRFLRYVMPGLVFITETMLLLWIIIPDWTTDLISNLKKDSGLGVIFAVLLGSGGLGFLFSIIHHEICWWILNVDHRKFIRRLRDLQVISLVDSNTGLQLPNEKDPSPKEAWVILTSLWHQHMETSKKIKGAEPKAGMFVDLFHSIGTGRVASFFSWISALVIVFRVGELSCKPWPIILFVVANLIAGALLWIHVRNFHRVSLQAQGFIEEVLHDALMANRLRSGSPIETRVVIRPTN